MIVLLLQFGCSKGPIDVVSLRFENSVTDLDTLYTYNDEEVLPETPLTLEDVLEIIFCRNLDLVVQEHERNVQSELAIAEELKMLPPLTLDGIFAARNKNTASLTEILGQPQPIIQPQISSIKETRQWDVRDTLNLIDFGLSYFKSRQEKARTQIIDQQHLRVRQKLILDATTSYWKAIASKKMIEEASRVIALSTKFQSDLEKQMALRTISEIQGLQTESKLVDSEIQLHTLQYQLESAKTELTGFMGLPPGTPFELADVEISDEEIEVADIQELEEQALFYRPELSAKDLEERIARESVRMAILQMFPNASLFTDYNADGNPFLIFNYWISAGVRATWNLFNIPQQWHLKKAAEQQGEQAFAARLALSIAVMSQVHIAYLGYQDALSQYRLVDRAYNVKERLARAAEKGVMAGEFAGVDAMNFASEAAVAKMQALRAYAQLQIAIEALDYAVGIPLLFSDVDIYGTSIEDVEIAEDIPEAFDDGTEDEELFFEDTPEVFYEEAGTGDILEEFNEGIDIEDVEIVGDI